MSDTRAATERHLLHFQAAPDPAGEQALIFHAGAAHYRVQAHTPATRAEARVGNPLLQQLDDAQFSHYLEVDLPASHVVLTYLTQATEVAGAQTDNFLALAVHVPRESRRQQATRAGSRFRPHQKLAWLFDSDDLAQASPLLAQLAPGDLEADFLADLINPFDTAAALLAQHPSLINLNAESGAPAIILRDCVARALHRRTRLVSRIQRLGARWSARIPLLDNGEPVSDEEGPVFTSELHADLPPLITEPLQQAIRYANQLRELQGHTWNVQYGSTTQETDAVQVAQEALRQPAPQDSETRWTLQALTRMNGVETDSNVVFQPPREGGWTISRNWPVGETPRLRDIMVSALRQGRVFARVDVDGHAGVWSGTFPAQNLREDEATQFRTGSGYAEVVLSLDDLREDLGVQLNLGREAGGAVLTALHLGVRYPEDGSEAVLWSATPSTRGVYGNLQVTVRNHWLRYLSAYVEFYDTRGNVIALPDWESRLPAPVARLFDAHPTRKYIEMLLPVETVFGYPLSALRTRLDIPVPAQAASLKLYWGGLGTGRYDASVCPGGITATAVICMGFPVLLMLLGTRIDALMAAVLRDPGTRNGLLAIGAGVIGNFIGLSQNPGRAARSVALALGPALAKGLAKKLALHLARKTAEGTAKRAIPFINIMFQVIDAAITVAELGQTTAAVLQSPFYYATQLTRTFDLHITIRPDAEQGFPPHRHRVRVQVMYDTGNTLPLSESPPPYPLGSSMPVHFNNIPAGGRIRVLVFFYAENGWQSASGSTAWLQARGSGDSAVLAVDVQLKNALIPLSRDSVYRHHRALGIEGGGYVWQRRPAPTTTITQAGPLQSLVGITVSQRPGMLAYAWQARDLNLPADRPGAPVNTNLYTMKNISVSDEPQSRRATSPFGFTERCGVAYDLGAPDDGSGANFYLDSSNPHFEPGEDGDEDAPGLRGGFHLRRIALSSNATPRFEPGSGASWGRFPVAVDSFVVHPQGYVAAVSASQSKLYVLELPAQPGDDRGARMASQYGGSSESDGDGADAARAGLLSRPCAIAVALDGRLLVLEDGNRRIQCFDISGNPVAYFRQPGRSERSALLPLRSGGSASHLDLSVEARGYLFVLVQEGSGASPDHYRVDIYEPDGTFLVSTPRVAAQKIAVDLARSLYTLNWEHLRSPEGRPEPSVSLWLAPPPDAAGGEEA
jgi:hypothetical protein